LYRSSLDFVDKGENYIKEYKFKQLIGLLGAISKKHKFGFTIDKNLINSKLLHNNH